MNFESRTLYTDALALWMNYGARSPDQLDGVPASELRTVFGLPFSLYVIQGESGPREGTLVAAVVGDSEDLAKIPDGPLVRLHSGCQFSEIGDSHTLEERFNVGVNAGNLHDVRFPDSAQRSEDCDCREQRIAAQALIAEHGGVYISLPEQEGRGWGIEVKREIYRLHREEGVDTVEACERLGIEPDVRRYTAASRFLLQDLGLTKIRLLSNNPRKTALDGIKVTPVSLVAGVKPTSIDYQKTKRDKLGHQFPDDVTLHSQLNNPVSGCE